MVYFFLSEQEGVAPLLIILKNEKKFEQQQPNKTREHQRKRKETAIF
jgi:hypothetical protein